MPREVMASALASFLHVEVVPFLEVELLGPSETDHPLRQQRMGPQRGLLSLDSISWGSLAGFANFETNEGHLEMDSGGVQADEPH